MMGATALRRRRKTTLQPRAIPRLRTILPLRRIRKLLSFRVFYFISTRRSGLRERPGPKIMDTLPKPLHRPNRDTDMVNLPRPRLSSTRVITR